MAPRRVRGQHFKDEHLKEFGLQKVNASPVVVRCLFCYHFGRESSPDGKRKRTLKVKRFEKGQFQPYLYRQHLEQHPIKWAAYRQVEDNPDARVLFFGAAQAPLTNTLNQSWGGGRPEPIISGQGGHR
jgi:hypothetical protein